MCGPLSCPPVCVVCVSTLSRCTLAREAFKRAKFVEHDHGLNMSQQPPGMALRLGPPNERLLRVTPPYLGLSLSLSRVMLTVSAAVVSQVAQDVTFERGGSAARPGEQ